jgi:hypothetical protein
LLPLLTKLNEFENQQKNEENFVLKKISKFENIVEKKDNNNNKNKSNQNQKNQKQNINSKNNKWE